MKQKKASPLNLSAWSVFVFAEASVFGGLVVVLDGNPLAALGFAAGSAIVAAVVIVATNPATGFAVGSATFFIAGFSFVPLDEPIVAVLAVVIGLGIAVHAARDENSKGNPLVLFLALLPPTNILVFLFSFSAYIVSKEKNRK